MISLKWRVTEAAFDSEEREGTHAIARTARLSLRRFNLDDAPFVLRLLMTQIFYALSVIAVCATLATRKIICARGQWRAMQRTGMD